ncbi:hypothetical protein [Bacillus sp. KH172YL63]|uniref:hypothetical protein n=1 Tax=Bacillus sp. KH172YL63 TaxID=2709784 RepID=UPI0013E4E2AB|nr:hypothetical protein [Bacillus sp. KH172YL63]BCB04006.1 hypothetical protein KH172YL63_21390 [Bacillus sp. KH172YL63]
MLFHYHFWTPNVEETEKFYVDNGFRISQRIGKYRGEFQAFNPPLTWDDFGEKNILFRIIEARLGAVNITFGFGKRIMFDHIGYLVSMAEHDNLCVNAKKLKWDVQIGERRTFITTSYGFKIELQVNTDVIDEENDCAEISRLKMITKEEGLENDLSILFEEPVQHVFSQVGDKVTIKEAVIKGFGSSSIVDPNGVRLIGE